MLDERGIAYRYREYTQEPLSLDELRNLFELLDATPRDALRTRDRAAKDIGLSGEESADELLEHMAHHPTLLQRPIGIVGQHAVIGRPPERLLEIL